MKYIKRIIIRLQDVLEYKYKTGAVVKYLRGRDLRLHFQ